MISLLVALPPTGGCGSKRSAVSTNCRCESQERSLIARILRLIAGNVPCKL